MMEGKPFVQNRLHHSFISIAADGWSVFDDVAIPLGITQVEYIASS